jgi:hypothetical protein
MAKTDRIVVQLLPQITGVEARQARRGNPVARAVQAVAGEAGLGRPALTAAQGHQFAVSGQPLIRPAGPGAAAAQAESQAQQGQWEDRGAHRR